MKQYPEQAAVLSLEELLDGKNSVTFDHCSILIDEFLSNNKIASNVIIGGTALLDPDLALLALAAFELQIQW